MTADFGGPQLGWRSRFAPGPFPRGPRGFASSVLCAAVLACAAPAAASETQWWVVDATADHANSESRGVIVRADGSMTLGRAVEHARIDSVDVIWALAVRKDGTVILGGEKGALFTWTRSRGVRPWIRLAAGQVFSLAADGDDIIAGTGPDGIIYRVTSSGDTTRLAATGERYVWALAPAGRGAWYAATGTRGRLVRVGRDGVEMILDTDETNLVSLAPDGRGGVFAGGDSKGRVLHVQSDGTARTLFDAPEDEIRALSHVDGAVYAAALSARAVSDGNENDGERPGPRPRSSSAARDRSLLYRIVPDSAVAAIWESPNPTVFAALATPEGVALATGDRGALFVVEGPGQASQWLSVPQRQMTALARHPDGALVAATSNPAALWILGPERARRGEIDSDVLDAKRVSRFGAVRWIGDEGGGRVTLMTRSGNTETPDTTWSPWRALANGRAASPAARHIQWRLVLDGGRPEVSSVELAWRENNLAPWVGNLRLGAQGEGVREGALSPRSEPVTQELDDGRRVEFSLKRRADERDLRALPEWMQGLRVVAWSAFDPNEDLLRFDLHVRSEGGGPWIEVLHDLSDSMFVWDTRMIRDGRYRLRVTASDAVDNAVGEERTATAVSGPFTVDNTAPELSGITATPEPGGIRLRGRVRDASSPVWRIEVALDDSPWRIVAPEGGLTDDLALAFDARLPGVAPGVHSLRVRAVDRAGNATIEAAQVDVTR